MLPKSDQKLLTMKAKNIFWTPKRWKDFEYVIIIMEKLKKKKQDYSSNCCVKYWTRKALILMRVIFRGESFF